MPQTYCLLYPVILFLPVHHDVPVSRVHPFGLQGDVGVILWEIEDVWSLLGQPGVLGERAVVGIDDGESACLYSPIDGDEIDVQCIHELMQKYIFLYIIHSWMPIHPHSFIIGLYYFGYFRKPTGLLHLHLPTSKTGWFSVNLYSIIRHIFLIKQVDWLE